MSNSLEPQSEPVVRAALVCVGGTPAPVLYVLRQVRPLQVWYFCSPDSRHIADAIHFQLDWRPDRDFVEVDRFEELGPCYRALRQAIPSLLDKWKVRPREVLVDYTGGTKTMSAALVLAATEMFQQFSYVGGQQRQKAGLGVTLDGKERFVYQGNPWSELAVREVERARDLWAGCQFESAARVLREAADRVPKQLRFQALADLADAMAARHRLDFPNAVGLLNQLTKRLPPLYDGHVGPSPVEFATRSFELCRECSTDKAGPAFLREVLDNASRTAAQGRYDDAAARLYRAMEMQGQIWLAEATAGAFVNGKFKHGQPLPAKLAKWDKCKPCTGEDIKLSMEQLYEALHLLDDHRAERVIDDLRLEKKSRWRIATEKRNASILGHGTLPIGREGFDKMAQLAADFLGFELSNTANPIPPLDAGWL